MQCGTCKHWFCHAPIDVIYGVAWGKCMLAQEKSRETFHCGSWETSTQVENDLQSRIASLESQLVARNALVECLVEAVETYAEFYCPTDKTIGEYYKLRALIGEWRAIKEGEK